MLEARCAGAVGYGGVFGGVMTRGGVKVSLMYIRDGAAFLVV